MATTRADRDEAIAANKAIADAFGDRSSFLWISRYSSAKHPLPFYQSALGDRLEYDLTFNDYSRVILASYRVENISLELDIVNQPDFTRLIANQ